MFWATKLKMLIKSNSTNNKIVKTELIYTEADSFEKKMSGLLSLSLKKKKFENISPDAPRDESPSQPVTTKLINDALKK